MKKKYNKYLLFSVIILLGVSLDQFTKAFARTNLLGQPRKSYWNGFFTLTYAENDGAFLSLGTDWPPTVRLIFLTIIPGLFLVGLMVYLLRSNRLSLLENIAFAVIAAGGVGNIIDRILEGKVVDFMVMKLFSLHTGVFNVADLYIMFGIGLFLVSYIEKMRREKKEASSKEPTS